MQNVLIIGASGNIARKVTDFLLEREGYNLTLFVRRKSRLSASAISKARVVEGDVLNYDVLRSAVAGQDIVYVNLAGDLEKMATYIVRAMLETGVKRVVFISSIGIYDMPLKSVLVPYRRSADVFESSGLDYTILRPTWFTNADEVDYETTQKGEPERGSVISQKSLATLIVDIIEHPDNYSRQNLGVNKPGS